jgi:predicted dehydrogenase
MNRTTSNDDTDQTNRSRAGGRALGAVVVGCGAMGQRHARVLSSLPERFSLIGVVDEDGARAAELAARYGTRPLDARAWTREEADLVVVATPIATHLELCRAALARGSHVLVEKPIGASAEDARALVRDSASAKGRLFVGHSERFNPVVRALVRLLRRDPPLALELHRIGPLAPRPREIDLGALMNLGVHDLDLVAHLTKSRAEMRDALGRALASHEEGAAEDLAHVLVATASGAAAHLYVDRTSREKHRTVRVTTARFIYEGDLLAHKLVRAPRAGGPKQDVPLVLEEPLVAQAVSLSEAIRGARSAAIATAQDGARAVELAESAAARIAAREASAENLSRFARP